jgi:hypothetical protein
MARLDTHYVDIDGIVIEMRLAIEKCSSEPWKLQLSCYTTHSLEPLWHAKDTRSLNEHQLQAPSSRL